MRFSQLTLWSALALTLTIPSFAAARNRRGPTPPKPAAKHSTRSAKAKVVGQRSIDDERATQIQDALIKAGYLTGTPSGHWDSTTEAAMSKVQSDNGWQTKLVPDSRALIKLGLGPTNNTASVPSPTTETIAEARP